jgi:hypothetical protein
LKIKGKYFVAGACGLMQPRVNARVEISLTKGKTASIDRDDFRLVSQFKWRAALMHGLWYAVVTVNNVGRPGRSTLYMHRLILGFPPASVDHRNGNGLDNRRLNLRVAGQSNNMANSKLSKRNTSGYKGVIWSGRHKKWFVNIRCRGRQHFLGLFDDKRAAAGAYSRAAKRLFGEFART